MDCQIAKPQVAGPTSHQKSPIFIPSKQPRVTQRNFARSDSPAKESSVKKFAKMSRFFRGGDDSSTDSSSSDEEELYSEEEEQEEQEESSEEDSDEESEESSSDEEGERRQGAAQFLRDVSSESEDSDEEVRAKVKSAKDKRLDELESSIKQIENGQKNGDWTLISAGTV